MTQIYCENDGCAVRDILVHTKDHLEDKPVKDPTGWRCPVCGGKVTVHWHRTEGEYQQYALEEAIGLVNSALYRREHSGEIGQPVCPHADGTARVVDVRGEMKQEHRKSKNVESEPEPPNSSRNRDDAAKRARGPETGEETCEVTASRAPREGGQADQGRAGHYCGSDDVGEVLL